MMPRKDDEVLVDLLDVILRDGVVLRVDVIVSVADIPLVGLKLTAVLAGMDTMTEYGLFEKWDTERRRSALTRRQYGDSRNRVPARSNDTNTTPSTDTTPNANNRNGSSESNDRNEKR